MAEWLTYGEMTSANYLPKDLLEREHRGCDCLWLLCRETGNDIRLPGREHDQDDYSGSD